MEFMMGQITLQTTTLGRATALQQQAERALPFLISYKDMVLVPEVDVQTLAKMRTFSNTVLNELAVLAGNEGKYSSVNFLNFNGFTGNVPEILTVNDVIPNTATITNATIAPIIINLLSVLYLCDVGDYVLFCPPLLFPYV